MTGEKWHLSVLIPARNEEELLPRCLQSVMAAREVVLGVATCDIIVVVDRSIDLTFAIAEEILGNAGAVVRCDSGVVGIARATAASIALERSKHLFTRTWLANTDADCWVPRTWLIDQLEFAAAGVQAVAGTIDVDSFAEHADHVPGQFRSTYLLHADGTHPHVHGANLGIRADAYLSAGGWAGLETAEDHDLWRRLEVSGALRQSASHLQVITSGRRTGRAPMGFAGALAAHNEVTLEA